MNMFYMLSLLIVILSAVFTLRHTFSPMKECVRHSDDALGDAWSCTSAFVCIGVFNRRLSVFTIFMLLSVLNTVCFTVCKFFLALCLVFSFVLV